MNDQGKPMQYCRLGDNLVLKSYAYHVQTIVNPYETRVKNHHISQEGTDWITASYKEMLNKEILYLKKIFF